MSDDHTFHPNLTDAQAVTHHDGLRGLWRSIAISLGFTLGELPSPVPANVLSQGIIVNFAPIPSEPGAFYASSVLSPWGLNRFKGVFTGVPSIPEGRFWSVLGQEGIVGELIQSGPDDTRSYAIVKVGTAMLPTPKRTDVPDAETRELLKQQWRRLTTAAVQQLRQAS